MGLRSIVPYALAGSTIVTWLSWPASESAPARVEIGGPCSAATRQWAEAWRGAPTAGGLITRVSVLCGVDGKSYTAMLISGEGRRLIAWRPVTTFFGPRTRHDTERVDIFDETGRLMEYATLDRAAGRVRFHSPDSRLIGSGRLDTSSGWVERFSIKGRRQGRLLLPVPPDVEDQSSR